MRALIVALSLESAINDALEVNEVLENRGYSTILLLESRAKYNEIVEAMSWLAKSRKSLFYFAGHSKEGNLLCYDNILKPRGIEKRLISKLRGRISVILDCCGDIKIKDNENVVTINNVSRLAYDRVINGKRRGLLTYYLLGTLRRYNYNMNIRDLEIELNSKLMMYNQGVKIRSTMKRLEI